MLILELVLGALIRIGQILQQPDHIGLQQPKPLRATYRDLFLLDFLELVDPLADVHPASRAGVPDDWAVGLFF